MADVTLDPAGGEPALTHDGLWSAGRRALTLGLVLTITLVAFEALAVSTIMPKVAADLGQIALYGWVFTAFFLGSLLGIVIVGGLIDQGGLVRPFIAGLGLFSVGLVIGGLAPSMPVLVGRASCRGWGAGRSRRSPTSASGGHCPRASGRGCSPRCRRPGSSQGSSARR